jgi:hypothetical protein
MIKIGAHKDNKLVKHDQPSSPRRLNHYALVQYSLCCLVPTNILKSVKVVGENHKKGANATAVLQ